MHNLRVFGTFCKKPRLEHYLVIIPHPFYPYEALVELSQVFDSSLMFRNEERIEIIVGMQKDHDPWTKCLDLIGINPVYYTLKSISIVDLAKHMGISSFRSYDAFIRS